jgi:Flp pilus assembly protein TadG
VIRRCRSGAPGGFAADRRGIAAVEFALMLPVLIGLYLGASELAQYISNARKVALATRSVADLISRQTLPVTTESLQNTIRAARAILAPFDPGSATITVLAVGVYDDAATQVKVCSGSQSSGNAEPPAIGATTSSTGLPAVPAAYKAKGTRYVAVILSMTYKPMLGSSLASYLGGQGGVAALKDQIVWPVRGGTQANGIGPEAVLPGGVVCPVNF